MAKDRVERDEEDLVRLYLTDIGQYALLTKEDEVELAQAIEAGAEARAELEEKGRSLSPARRRELRKLNRAGEAAERRFVQSNLRLVVSIAKKYQASGVSLLPSHWIRDRARPPRKSSASEKHSTSTAAAAAQ